MQKKYHFFRASVLRRLSSIARLATLTFTAKVLGLIPGYGSKFYFHILKENKTNTSMNTRLHVLKQQSNFKSACVKNKREY